MLYTDPVADLIAASALVLTFLGTRNARKLARVERHVQTKNGESLAQIVEDRILPAVEADARPVEIDGTDGTEGTAGNDPEVQRKKEGIDGSI